MKKGDVIKVVCLKSDDTIRTKKGQIYEMRVVNSDYQRDKIHTLSVLEYIDRNNRYNRLTNIQKFVDDGILRYLDDLKEESD